MEPVVMWAVYGTKEKSIDVSVIFNQKLVDAYNQAQKDGTKKVILEIDNSLFGEDPDSEHTKQFTTHYIYEGVNMSLACREGQKARFDRVTSISIEGAIFGSKHGSFDVANIVTDMINQGEGDDTIITADVKRFGNPSGDEVKQLGMVFTYDGVRLTASCEEGQSVNLDEIYRNR